MSLTGIQKKIADKFLRTAINNHVKKLAKKGVELTSDKVFQDMTNNSLNTLMQQGYMMEEIRGMVEESIKRQKK